MAEINTSRILARKLHGKPTWKLEIIAKWTLEKSTEMKSTQLKWLLGSGDRFCV
jgi:hypothetical protein